MPDIRVLFFDVGGVLLTNGWDRAARRAAVEHFELDWEEFRDRHDFVAPHFETGELTLADYLARTVFYRDRSFSPEAFYDFMKDQSGPLDDSLELIAQLATTDRYLLATLNNESRELNEYRIERFGLGDLFAVFLTSCYLGVRKPEEAIYRLAVDITQHLPERCLFVDDRPLNLECATLVGMHTVHFRDVPQLRDDLVGYGVEVAA